jgi:hypothetical protein
MKTFTVGFRYQIVHMPTKSYVQGNLKALLWVGQVDLAFVWPIYCTFVTIAFMQ